MSHLESSGVIWSHLESSGIICSHLESSGIIWNHLESSGTIWSHLESPRRHPGDAQEAPRMHPGDTQEAPRRHPEAPRAPEVILEVLDSKIDAPLSYNHVFHRKPSKSIEFLKKYRFCIGFYNESVRTAGPTVAGYDNRPSYQNRQNPYR